MRKISISTKNNLFLENTESFGHRKKRVKTSAFFWGERR
jgi:hypothetical protein